MIMTIEKTKKALSRLDALVHCFPKDIDVLSVEIPDRINGREFIAGIFLHNADLEAIKENLNIIRLREEAMENYPETFYQYFVVDGIAVYQLKERAAALSGTEDSGKDETRHQNDTTGNGGCQDGMGRT